MELLIIVPLFLGYLYIVLSQYSHYLTESGRKTRIINFIISAEEELYGHTPIYYEREIVKREQLADLDERARKLLQELLGKYSKKEIYAKHFL